MKVLTDTLTIEKITKAMLFHDDEPFATSLKISQYFGIRHDDLLRKIRSFHSFDELIKLRKITELKRDYRGQKFPYFELDADAFAFTCLSITGKKAEVFKWAFIEAFKQATAEAISVKVAIQCNKANEAWIEARCDGKDTRRSLSDKIKDFCHYAEEQRGESYGKNCPYFKIITDAIYNHLDIEAPKGGKAPRDTLSGDRVEAIERAEAVVMDFLDEVMEMNSTRQNLKARIIERLNQNEIF
ncbi:Rha family transcriptional regulator [Sulfuricurvum sp.]|uniref:Rha family transcriptional regulator n=1 Tax=Sulfuricurvum sp. TaxID=2025608 RepID=UPI00260F99FC|nr:Rha family transcriptional regulator [Sulfuricurvum sp.]MDD2265777.1 Rha family transcriptional regulator [Sulfuricurvum sp.]MDD2783104.1 Rha family transcriptional regulator [Sulfuricurvum sp.]